MAGYIDKSPANVQPEPGARENVTPPVAGAAAILRAAAPCRRNADACRLPPRSCRRRTAAHGRRRACPGAAGGEPCLAVAESLPAVTYIAADPVAATAESDEVTHHLCRPFDLCHRDAGRRADRHRLQRRLRRRPAAARRHHEQGAPHALHRPARPGHRIRAARLEPGRRPGQARADGRRRLYPQRADRHPPSGARWSATATRSSSSRSPASASAISAICIITWRTRTTPPSAGSTSSWCRSTAA